MAAEGDYLGAYQKFLQEFIANIRKNDQLPVKTTKRDIRDLEIYGEIADITLQHLNPK